jgi:hypothetical protein
MFAILLLSRPRERSRRYRAEVSWCEDEGSRVAIVGRHLQISSFTVEYEDKEMENCTTDFRTLANNRGEGVDGVPSRITELP